MSIRTLALASVAAVGATGLAAQTELARIGPARAADFHDAGAREPEKVRLGKLLFFDKILSGNRNISCATCHHPEFGTGDGLALSIGKGGVGLGPERRATRQAPVMERVPRNAQPLYFLGAREYTTFFHDGRVAAENRFWPSGFNSPARDDLPTGLDTALAAQAMFPVTSAVEMAGGPTENPVAEAAALGDLAGPDGVWERLADRLRDIPEYVELFSAAYAEIEAGEVITFAHAANAIAAFESAAFRADGSPFDAYLKYRDPAVLEPAARRGMARFYGEAGCSDCHAGKFQTDHEFHVIGMPRIGPGEGDGWDPSYWQATGYAARLEDYGRARVTKRIEDRFRFRTPGLHNVALTGPWGHDGAYAELADVVRHHFDPVPALDAYDRSSAALPPIDAFSQLTATGSTRQLSTIPAGRMEDSAERDVWVQQTPVLRTAIVAANELPARSLDDAAVDGIVAFLEALTDRASRRPERAGSRPRAERPAGRGLRSGDPVPRRRACAPTH